MKAAIGKTVDDMMTLDQLAQDVIIIRVWDGSQRRRVDITVEKDGTININANERIHIRPNASNTVNIRIGDEW